MPTISDVDMSDYTHQLCKKCNNETTHEDNRCLICVGAIKVEEVEHDINYDNEYKN